MAALDKWVPPLDFVRELANLTTCTGRARTLKKGITQSVRSFLGFMQYFSPFIGLVTWQVVSTTKRRTNMTLGLTTAPELGRIWLHV
jgi:hypothetical protein